MTYSLCFYRLLDDGDVYLTIEFFHIALNILNSYLNNLID